MFLGVFLLHPITMVIYWFEFHPAGAGVRSPWDFMLQRLTRAFEPSMLLMTFAFILLGGILGAGSAAYAILLKRRERRLAQLEEELGRGVGSLIRGGESERLEFKSTARWDLRRNAGNKELEMEILRSLAAFMNSGGGTVLIGVADDGSIVGLEHDYHTLRSKNRDGFERFLMDRVAAVLGGEVCRLVHVVFHEAEGKDICRVTVEASQRPAFVHEKGRSVFFVRTGNATRELDAEEVVRHFELR